MRLIKTEGIIIKRSNVGEADKLLTIFTRDNGKMHVKAPGIRKISSRRSPHLELLNRTTLTLYNSGRTPLVSEADMLTDYRLIKNDLTKVGYAYHMCELIEGLCPENEENDMIYTLLVETLDSLCLSEDSKSLIASFELRLLDLLGFASQRMRTSEYFNMHAYIESLLERKLKAKEIFL